MKPTVTVCASCKTAQCIKDFFPCENKGTGTVEMNPKELKTLDLEHEIYWDDRVK